MKDAVKTAEAILRHLTTNPKDPENTANLGGKGTGNTRTVIEGVAQTGGTMVVATDKEASRAYQNVRPKQVVSLGAVEDGVLESANMRGWPLVLDNSAMVDLLVSLVAEVSKARKAAKAKKEDKDTK